MRGRISSKTHADILSSFKVLKPLLLYNQLLWYLSHFFISFLALYTQKRSKSAHRCSWLSSDVIAVDGCAQKTHRLKAEEQLEEKEEITYGLVRSKTSLERDELFPVWCGPIPHPPTLQSHQWPLQNPVYKPPTNQQDWNHDLLSRCINAEIDQMIANILKTNP